MEILVALSSTPSRTSAEGMVYVIPPPEAERDPRFCGFIKFTLDMDMINQKLMAVVISANHF